MNPEQFKQVLETIKAAQPDQSASNLALIATVAIGVIAVIGAIISIIRGITKVGILLAKTDDRLTKNEEDIDNVGNKYRELEPVVRRNEKDIAVLVERVG